MTADGPPASVPPRATYRIQMRGDIGFQEARALVPYLAALGVSHVYCSPYVTARTGSSHGYDVVDPRRIDPALGGEAAFERFVAALRAEGMGHVLDWVPNHVGIAQGQNARWQDLLAFGPASPSAEFFDVDWRPGRPELRDKVLLPVLGAPYGEVLERGELVPVREPDGGLAITYFEHRFPVSPPTWGRLLAARLLGPRPPAGEPDAQETLRALLGVLARRTGGRAERVARARDAQRRLGELLAADHALAERVDAVVADLRGDAGRAGRFDALHRLLESQHYRLAWWRVAADEINYRRFFDIDELAALRMDRSEVFEEVHERVFAWIAAGAIDGLRIDHVDGLADPAAYCERIRRRFPAERLYLLVEKILGADESLPEGWPVDGTTGYEFLNAVNGLFVDPEGQAPLDALYRDFTGETLDFDDVLRASKQRVMRALLASELDGLANALDRLAQDDPHTRDFTERALRMALAEVVAAFPVYRSYVDASGASAADRAHIATAVDAARSRAEVPDSGLYEWLERVLTGDLTRGGPSAARHRGVMRFVARFQQYTAPVMAKGLEDTSFYRYHRLIAHTEVGGDPRRFAVSPEAFHAANRSRALRAPRTMLATSTHDTKRGEDVRARIDVLSERPEAWRRAVRTWSEINEGALSRVDGRPAPVRKDEYLLYQVLVGSFPQELPDPEALAVYCERVQAFCVKALREGKERSSWRLPRPDYEAAMTGFVARILEPGSPFIETFRPFQEEVALHGALNGLAQLVLKLTAPGVPDVYQGCEGWDLSLADPDNRRPVDFEALRDRLAALRQSVGPDGTVAGSELHALRAGWRDGRIKHLVTWRLLEARRRRPELFVGAGYTPLAVTGQQAGHVCAFARTHDRDAVVVAVPRLCAELPRRGEPFPLGRPAWGDTRVTLPEPCASASWRDAITGARVDAGAPGGGTGGGTDLAVATLFEALPLAVLVSDRRHS